uniref:Uncharacterized protein n=1 Tax=Tetraselmis sp. GSL018 TaxID=582737 RepID=A0A061RHS2_9CHLO
MWTLLSPHVSPQERIRQRTGSEKILCVPLSGKDSLKFVSAYIELKV